MKIILAQVNLLVGDIESNSRLIIHSASQAEQALRSTGDEQTAIVAFPELALTGYPPEDLLLRPSLAVRVEKALEQICAAQLNIYIVVGYPRCDGANLFNSLALIYGGEIKAVYDKQALPNYQVFDERRYFTAGSKPCVYSIEGIEVGFTICEDLWDDKPTLQLKNAGAELLVNINASPYHGGKVSERLALLAKRAKANGFPVVYVNLVGGQDELVFDGHSVAVDATGNVVSMACGFSECLHSAKIEKRGSTVALAADASQALSQTSSLPYRFDHEAELYHALVLGVRDYVNKNGFAGVVLGLSGGIDSALTLAIAVDALGKDRVEAVMMPFLYTSQLSLDAAATQAEAQGVKYKIIPIGENYESFITALADEFSGLDTDVTEQNIQARCRGVILMAISNKKGVLVLTTGNKSEIAVGYSTLYGDMAGGFDVLKDVSKTLVYRLASYRNERYSGRGEEIIPQSVIDRPPSAELAPGQVDQDSLPPYDVLDAILERYIENDQSAEAIIAAGFDRQQVNRVLRLVDLNEYKRRQSPVGPRLTARGFGRDRRYPITNGWSLGE